MRQTSCTCVPARCHSSTSRSTVITVNFVPSYASGNVTIGGKKSIEAYSLLLTQPLLSMCPLTRIEKENKLSPHLTLQLKSVNIL
jgi:hypothetical protein